MFENLSQKNTVMVSFNTTVRQMTKMSQQKTTEMFQPKQTPD